LIFRIAPVIPAIKGNVRSLAPIGLVSFVPELSGEALDIGSTPQNAAPISRRRFDVLPTAHARLAKSGMLLMSNEKPHMPASGIAATAATGRGLEVSTAVASLGVAANSEWVCDADVTINNS
jgi:hypothetical protein